MHQIGVGAAVDERQHPFAAHALGQDRGHDVVFIITGQRHEEIGLLDRLLQQQILIGRLAVKHQATAQPSGDVFCALAVVVDDLGDAFAFELPRHAQADIAAAGDDHPLHRILHALHFKQHGANMLFRRQHEDLVAGLDHRFALRRQRTVAPEQRGDARVDAFAKMFAQFADRLADHRAAGGRTHRHQRHAPFGKGKHLQGFREIDELDQIIGNRLFGTESVADRKHLVGQQARVFEKFERAQTGDACRHGEDRLRHLAHHQIGLVARRQRQQQVGVVQPGAFEHRRQHGVADDRAQIEAHLELLQPFGVGVDHRDVVIFRNQALRHASAHLSCAENDDFHKKSFGVLTRGGAAGDKEKNELQAPSHSPAGSAKTQHQAIIPDCPSGGAPRFLR